MAFDTERQDVIFRKTDGNCHICRKKLARKNYGAVGARGAWEVEHSIPRVKGGSNHLNNLYPACISCNRSKGASSTRASRKKHDYKCAPLSREKKTQNAWAGGIGGALAGRILLAPLGPLGVAAGALIGAAIGKSFEPN